jgi:hypothetical protein
MRFQINVTLTDGSKFFLEKTNITKKEIKEIRYKYKIPEYYSDKSLFVAKLFNEYELKFMLDFLFKNDYIKKYTVSKVNPFMLEDDVVPFSKISKIATSDNDWETISLGQINHLFVMGYGSISENTKLRKEERNHQGVMILLELINAEKSLENTEKLKDYLVNKKHIENISDFADKLLNSSQNEIEKNAAEFRSLLYPEDSNSDSEKFNKIIKMPKNNWQK